MDKDAIGLHNYVIKLHNINGIEDKYYEVWMMMSGDSRNVWNEHDHGTGWIKIGFCKCAKDLILMLEYIEELAEKYKENINKKDEIMSNPLRQA